jgi:hypothetical protein
LSRKRIGILLFVLALSPFIGLAGWVFLNFGPNIGLPFGYYAELNFALADLRRPGVAIVKIHLHRDISLEDFTIDTTVGARWSVWVCAYDGGADYRTARVVHLIVKEPGSEEVVESRRIELAEPVAASGLTGVALRTPGDLVQYLERVMESRAAFPLVSGEEWSNAAVLVTVRPLQALP